ncbi:MAG: porphobilinogen synthase [Candidatus Nanopelagicales bacterium]|nr:porphobilinogen synthase [Candidatus Nanopelagicales bacterium]
MYVQPESSDRPRRLRSTPAVRRLMAEVRVSPASLVQPLFVAESIEQPDPIPSMPGVVRHTLESGAAAVRRAADAGVGGVMLFGVPAHLDPRGSGADDPDGILNRAIGVAVDAAGDDLVVMADTCLDAFTDHGHCGVLSADGSVGNDATLRRYADIAAAQALAGAEVLGLSGMMDGQVAAVRAALDGAGRPDVAILAYTAKYASAWYGPFREAVSSQLSGDRRTYQMDPANRREAMREAWLDAAEGADILMVKPALGYLDVLADVTASADLPVWAYQVSGEYAAIEAAAANGWLDRDALMHETVLGIQRAGASAVLTYWATELAERLST